MKEYLSSEKGYLKTKNLIQVIIWSFVLILLCICVFLGRGFLLPGDFYQSGKINQRNIYAPFDFSFPRGMGAGDFYHVTESRDDNTGFL